MSIDPQDGTTEDGRDPESPAGDGETTAKRQTRATKPKKPKRPPPITVDAYNALWRSYQDEPDHRKAARAAGVKMDVARWYCVGPAWPEVGFTQLAERQRAVQGTVARLNDGGTAKWRAEQLKTLTEGLRTTSVGLALNQRALKETAEQVNAGELPVLMAANAFPLKDVVNAHDKLLRAALLTMGEADSLSATVDAPGRLNFAEWTAEECAAYYERGVVPAREKK